MENVFGAIVSCIYDDDNKKLEGFLLATSDSDSIRTISVKGLETLFSNPTLAGQLMLINAEYDSMLNSVIGKGRSLLEYPRITKKYSLLSSNALTVFCILEDAYTGKETGVVCYSGLGKRFAYSFDDFKQAAKGFVETDYLWKTNVDGVVRPYPNTGMKDFSHIRMKKLDNEQRLYNSYEESKKQESIKTENTKGKRGRPKKVTSNKQSIDTSKNKELVKGESISKQKGPFVEAKSRKDLPVLGVYTLDSLRTNSELNQSAQQNMFTASMNLKKLAPYYSVVYEAIEKKIVPGLGTMGVTESFMVYDLKMPAELSVAEISFVLIHEMMHICMQHSVRKGHRDSELWNIATDLYINSVICHDFGIKFGESEKKFPNGGVIKAPNFGVFLETINETLDFSRDTPETIYNKLYKENLKNKRKGSKSGNQGQQSGQQGQGQQGQGQQSGQGAIDSGVDDIKKGATSANRQAGNSGKAQDGLDDIKEGLKELNKANKEYNNATNEQEKQDAKSKMNNAVNKIQDGIDKLNEAMNDNGTGNSTVGKKASERMQQGIDKLQQGINSLGQQGQGNQAGQACQSGQSSQDGQSEQNDQNGSDNGQGNQAEEEEDIFEGLNDGTQGSEDGPYPHMKNVNVSYNGKKIQGKVMIDVMTTNANKDVDSVKKKLDESKKILQRIKTKVRIASEEMGEELTKEYGIGGSLVQRHVEFGLTEGIDWRALLKNICVTSPRKMYIISKPNRNYMNRGMTVATRQKIGEPTKASNFVVAIDVSGSVSKQKLEYFLSEVNALAKYYDVDGELIYWSTNVGDAGQFSTMKDLLKIQPNTTGGTDVKCVFDYLTGKITTATGKREENKIKDIRGVFIITDGYFSKNYGDYADYFDRRTVWLIDGNPVTFDAAFGKVMGLETPDNIR